MAGFDLMELLLQPGGMNPSAGIGPGGLNWTTPGYLARPEAGPEAQDIDLLSLLAPRPNVEQPQLNRFQRFAAGLSRLPIRFSLGPSAGAGANVGAGLYGLLSAIGTPYAQEQDRARAAQRAVDEQNRDLTMAARRLGIASALRRAEAKNKPAEVSEARLRSGLLGPEAQKAYEESVRRTQAPRAESLSGSEALMLPLDDPRRARYLAGEKELRTPRDTEAGKASPPDVIATLAESILSGQSKLTDYLPRDRDNIVQYIRDSKQTLLPTKARDTLQILNAAKSVLGQLREVSATVNTGSGAAGYVAGVRAAAQGGFTQRVDVKRFYAKRQGFLSTLARATGEKGTLAEGDVKRARAMMPNILDSKEVAEAKLRDLENWLAEQGQRSIETYTTKLPAQTPGARGSTVRMERGGRFFQIPADQVRAAEADGLRRVP